MQLCTTELLELGATNIQNVIFHIILRGLELVRPKNYRGNFEEKNLGDNIFEKN